MEKAEGRCDVERDAGWTKADKVGGDLAQREFKYFCIYFAKGLCALGHKCNFRHRIPTPADGPRLAITKDIFGRDRHASHKDDMGGTGNFMENTRTLYVGGLRNIGVDMGGKNAKAYDEGLWKIFGEWGEVEHINVIYRLSIGFVRYRLRLNAEFAREAMLGQDLVRLGWEGGYDVSNCVKMILININVVFSHLISKGEWRDPQHPMGSRRP